MSKTLSIEIREGMSSIIYTVETDIEKYTLNDIFNHCIKREDIKNFYQCQHKRNPDIFEMYSFGSKDFNKKLKDIRVNYGDTLCFFRFY